MSSRILRLFVAMSHQDRERESEAFFFLASVTDVQTNLLKKDVFTLALQP